MTEERIYARLTDVFRDVFEDQAIVLRPETTAQDVPGWDSFNHIKVIVATEEAFGIRFRSAQLEGLRNVGHFVDVISSKAK